MIFRKKILLMVIMLFYLCFLYAEKGGVIYFYNPEATANDYAGLKYQFDSFFANYGAYKFQPFNEKKILLANLIRQNDYALILSSIEYKILSKEYNLEPIMIGEINGKTTYKKILVSKNSSIKSSFYNGALIATTGNAEINKKTLIQILGNNAKQSNLKILVVPKDIDALMSVAFGMAEYAYVSENSFQDFLKINEKQAKMMNKLLVSNDILLPLIVVQKNSNKKDEFLFLIEKMNDNPQGKKLINTIGLDSWQIIKANDLKKLGESDE